MSNDCKFWYLFLLLAHLSRRRSVNIFKRHPVWNYISNCYQISFIAQGLGGGGGSYLTQKICANCTIWLVALAPKLLNLEKIKYSKIICSGTNWPISSNFTERNLVPAFRNYYFSWQSLQQFGCNGNTMLPLTFMEEIGIFYLFLFTAVFFYKTFTEMFI